jgi:Na+-driven multidrug efflux pump
MGYGVEGVVWAVVIAEVVLSGLALWVFTRGKWKLMEV